MSRQINSAPLVSIVTPSYNQGQFLESTLRSVMNQDYPHIEHVVVDGGSSDRTIDLLSDYASQYVLRWISEPDEGQADALNKGFALANGEIIGWLNSDDCYVFRNAVRTAVALFTQLPNADVLHGNRAVIDESNNLIRLNYSREFDYDQFLAGNCTIYQETVFMSQSVTKRFQVDTAYQFAMDSEFWLRIGKEFEVRYANDIWGAFRVHQTSKTVSSSHRKGREREKHELRCKYGKSVNNVETPASLWVSKARRFLAGMYRNYWRLPLDMLVFIAGRNRRFAFPLKCKPYRYPDYLIKSLSPHVIE